MFEPGSTDVVDRPCRGSLITEVDESALVAAAQNGDSAAMERLLGEHFNYVTALCRRMLGDPADAEDARQEALLQVARRIESFDGRSSFRTWLHTVTRNACLTENRAAARRRTVLAAELPETLNLPQSLERIAERLDLESALTVVTDEFRDVLVLWFFCDMSYNDIAGTLNINLNTVRSRLRRGKAQLRELLGEPRRVTA